MFLFFDFPSLQVPVPLHVPALYKPTNRYVHIISMLCRCRRGQTILQRAAARSGCKRGQRRSPDDDVRWRTRAAHPVALQQQSNPIVGRLQGQCVCQGQSQNVSTVCKSWNIISSNYLVLGFLIIFIKTIIYCASYVHEYFICKHHFV